MQRVEGGGCLGKADQPKGLLMSCLEPQNAIDITVVVILRGNFLGHSMLPISREDGRRASFSYLVASLI